MKTDIYDLVIVDDHKLFRDGIKMLLSNFNHFNVVGEASNGIEFLSLIENKLPDLVLMDISMPEMNGLEATRIALENHPDLKILVLSMFQDQEYYTKMIEYGSNGFVLKEAGAEELIDAINTVLKGNNYFSQELLRNIILNLSSAEKRRDKGFPPGIQLTSREKEVLEQICMGKTTAEMAEILFISQRTVETHRANLLSKTQCTNSINLVVFAFKEKLVKM